MGAVRSNRSRGPRTESPPEPTLVPTSELSNAAGAVVFAYFLLGMGFYTWAEGWSAADGGRRCA